jgi:hypothetical protein
MSKWKHRVVWASAVVTVCIVYLWFFGSQTFFALWARNVGRKVPIVKSVPVDLKDVSVSQAKGERVSFMGTEFEVPWDDVDEEKTRIVGSWLLVNFQSGNSIILCVTPPDGFIAEMTKSKTPDPELFNVMYGPGVLRSDYTLYKAIFETTPSQINLFTPPNRAAGLSAVILIKAIMPPTTDWAIYRIQTQNFRGFQLGDPARRPKKMCLELFGDDVHFEINIEQNTSSAGRGISQAELNRIIQTAHRVPHADSKFAVSPL